MSGYTEQSADRPARKIGIPPSPDHRETPQTKIGIYDENDPLRFTSVWGALGSEAVLAQLYLYYDCLFSDKMDVPKARDESIRFEKILNRFGVETFSVREKIAQMMKPSTISSPDDLITQIVAKAEKIKKSTPERLEELIAEEEVTEIKEINKYRSQIESYPTQAELTNTVHGLVYADIELYGLYQAIALNNALCLKPNMALGNSMFARDQMNVILGQRIVSSMKYPIRQGEVMWYEQIYKNMGLPDPVKLPGRKGYTFEGGDVYVHDGIVYIGVGRRTSLQAAKYIFCQLYPELQSLGFRFALVEDPTGGKRPNSDNMDYMHLDTFSNPIGSGQIIVCPDEADFRRVSLLEKDGCRINKHETHQNFTEFLRSVGQYVIEVPKKEQKTFGVNFLALDNDVILIPRADNPETIRLLQEAGKELVYVGLDECTNGYGASHCMTGQLARYK